MVSAVHTSAFRQSLEKKEERREKNEEDDDEGWEMKKQRENTLTSGNSHRLVEAFSALFAKKNPMDG